MPTLAERVSVVETQVVNLDEKLDELKSSVKDVHDCLDNNRETLMGAISRLQAESSAQHAELAGKVSAIEKLRDKYTYMAMGGVAVGAFFLGHMGLFASISKLFK